MPADYKDIYVEYLTETCDWTKEEAEEFLSSDLGQFLLKQQASQECT